MFLECPLCGKSVDTADFKITREAHGGFECPECKKVLQFAQPHAAFRRSMALVLSALVLMVLGVQRPVWILIGSIVLWPFVQLLVNTAMVHRIPLRLAPWKAPKLPILSKLRFEERDDGPLQLFDRRRK